MRRAVLLASVLSLAGCYQSHQLPRDGDVPDAIDCDAQDADALPGCTIGVPGWWSWTGTRCEGHVCACHGSDCASAFASEDACLAAYASCPRIPGAIGR